MSRPVLVWFRRDLRTEDHAALWHAAQTGAPVVPVFIVDTELIEELPSDGALFDFQAACLTELAQRLEELGAPLCVRYGRVEEVFRSLFQELAPAALYYNRDYEPYARKRDAAIEQLARAHGVEVRSFKDHVLHEPWELATAEGNPFVVYTPFYRVWRALPKPEPFGQPECLRGIERLVSEPMPTSDQLARKRSIPAWAVEPGTAAARRRWEQFRCGGLLHYRERRNFPALEEGTSRMSPHLRFGTISIRRLYADAAALLDDPVLSEDARASIESFIFELAWREFFQHVLWHFPETPQRSFRRWMDDFPWEGSEEHFRAWVEGRTGYPLVDAGMRELRQTGYMHNRVRMVVASFLVKDLHLDWRWGERYFRSLLLDGELAANVGNWQWAASAGVDARPLRIFNPVLQSKRFDPEGAYIRRWVPELRALPTEFLHEPWRMDQTEQARCGVRLGEDYPYPIVDHAERTARFAERFALLKGRWETTRGNAR
ncbi:Deoxyribodipyrimidine photo-lyase [bacterium HR10]|nr:Deoxyribodipyrimidine photo-lyase [bacterium HR10]